MPALLADTGCSQIRFRNELWNDCLPGGRDDGRARLYQECRSSKSVEFPMKQYERGKL